MPKTTDRPAGVTPSASDASATEPDAAAPDQPARAKSSTRSPGIGARAPKTESATEEAPVAAPTADPASDAESDASTTDSAVAIDGERNAAQDPVEVATATESELAGASPVQASVQDRVWEALRAHPGATAAELATEARVSRSTVTAQLDRWVTEGGVSSEPGVTTRAARRWTAEPSGPVAAAGPAAPHDTEPTAPTADAAAGQGPGDLTDDPAPDDTAPDDTAPGPEIAGAREEETAGIPTTSPAPASPVHSRKASTNRSGPVRLGAGALRGMVEEYLTEQPGEHGPVEIGKAISRSSGAVANALEKLTESGWAIRTSDKPRRYRIAEGDDAVPDTAGTGS